MAKIKPEFEERDVKIIGLSVDPAADHEKWATDIEETQTSRSPPHVTRPSRVLHQLSYLAA